MGQLRVGRRIGDREFAIWRLKKARPDFFLKRRFDCEVARLAKSQNPRISGVHLCPANVEVG
jgi:hypothetical protein